MSVRCRGITTAFWQHLRRVNVMLSDSMWHWVVPRALLAWLVAAVLHALQACVASKHLGKGSGCGRVQVHPAQIEHKLIPLCVHAGQAGVGTGTLRRCRPGDVCNHNMTSSCCLEEGATLHAKVHQRVDSKGTC